MIFAWIAVAVIARILATNWWAPGSFLGLILCANYIGTTLMAPEYYLSVTANLYLQLMVLVVSVATAIGQHFAAEAPAVPATAFTIRRPIGFLCFGMVTVSVSAFFTMTATGIKLSQLTSPLEIMRAAQRVTYQRYTEGLEFSKFYNISNAMLYAYAIVTAVHFAATKRIDWKLTIPILGGIALNTITTTRAPILFMLLPMAFAAVYVLKATSPLGEFISFRNGRFIKFAAAVGILVVGVFFLFQVLRFGEQSTRTTAEVWGHLRRYPWGSLPGFSLWYDGARANEASNVPGFYTFMGIYDNLGIATRQQLTYAEYNLLTRDEAANVYTVFRGLYHDFGIVGSALFMAAIGFLGGLVSKGRVGTIYMSLTIYVGIMTFVCFSIIVSFWAYTSNILALILVPLLLRYFTKQTQTVQQSIAASSH